MANKVNPRIRLVMSILLLLTISASIMGKTIYVDDDAAGANDGTSWDNAYVYLQDALADANDEEKPVEIRVAQGIYKPDQGANQTTGDREATFQLINNVIIKGGFAGIGELEPDVRHVEAYVTILSGDLNGDDVEVVDPEDLWDEPTRAENSYHILTGNLTDETAVLDGFVITGGNANGGWLTTPTGRGGGMYNNQSSPTLTNCTFSSNSAYYGGGMYNENSDPNSPVGDEPDPNGGIINMGAYGGTTEASMSPAGAEQIVYVQWLGHSTVKVWTDDCIVYVDPQNLSISPHDATLVCVTHTHGDHYSASDIAKVSNAETQFIAPPDVVQRYGGGLSIAPGQTMEFDFVNVKAVPSYNTNKPNHPKSNNWVGYIIELGGKRIYVAGDTDLIEEMKSFGDIDVAILPAGGTYTMNATEAAEATGYIKPDLAIPYHWGRNVGTLRDAETFAELARCAVKILTSGETISSDNWPVYSPLIAHWALDEAEGEIAHDIAGENHGTLHNEPIWQPAGGKTGGALQFDGVDDYISTDFVLNPTDGAFSVFAWIKGGAPYQVIISQVDILAGRSVKPGSVWLCVDPLDGKLMTFCGLASAGSRIPPPPLLVSESIITDGRWHHVGFVWDGSYRSLYVDGIEAARDTVAQNPLQSATGGLRIGAGNYLEAGNFFYGLIDDVRIYNVELSAAEIEALVH